MSNFMLKVKSQKGQEILKNLTAESTLSDLKLTLIGLLDLQAENINVLSGFPPKPVDMTLENRTLLECGIVSGETIIVEGNASKSDKSKLERPFKGMLLKKVVPSDNSCLFTSIGFVLNGKVDTTVGSYMRQIIAEAVLSDPSTYSEAFLGKANAEYSRWIQLPGSWGGAIEVSVLSRFFGIEMDVVDTLNAIINRFGEDQDYGQRVFLMFDGIHYDPLYVEHPQGAIQTLFPIEELDVYHEAQRLAKEMKSNRQSTTCDKIDCHSYVT